MTGDLALFDVVDPGQAPLAGQLVGIDWFAPADHPTVTPPIVVERTPRPTTQSGHKNRRTA